MNLTIGIDDEETWLGDDASIAELSVQAGYRVERVLAAAHLGYRYYADGVPLKDTDWGSRLTVGVGAAYRAETGCTIYLLEDHKYFLREVKEGAEVIVCTRVIGLWEKRFHLWMEMIEGGDRVATAEMMELHVNQHPNPHGTPIPDGPRQKLAKALLGTEDIAVLPNRARKIGD